MNNDPVTHIMTEQISLPYNLPGKRRRDGEPDQQQTKPSRFMAILKRLGGRASYAEPPSDSSGTSTPTSTGKSGTRTSVLIVADIRELPKPSPSPSPSSPDLSPQVEHGTAKPIHRQHSLIAAWEDFKTVADIQAPWNLPQGWKVKSHMDTAGIPPAELPTFPASNAALAPFTKASGVGNCLLSSTGGWTHYSIILSMSYSTPWDHGAAESRQKVAHLHLLRPSDWGSIDRNGMWAPVLVEVERRPLSHKTIVSADLAIDPVILVKFRDSRPSPAWSLHIDRWGERQGLLQHMQAMVYLMIANHNHNERAARFRFEQYPDSVRKLAAMSNAPHELEDNDEESSDSPTSSLDRFYIQPPSQHPHRLKALPARSKPIDIIPPPVSRVEPRVKPITYQLRPVDEVMRHSRAPGTERNTLQLRVVDPVQHSPPNFDVPHRSRPSHSRRRVRPEDERQAMREVRDNAAIPACPTSVPMKRDVSRHHRRAGVVGVPSRRPPPLTSLPPVPRAAVFRAPTSPHPAIQNPSRSTQASEDLQEILDSASAHHSSQSELLRGLVVPRPPRRTTNHPSWPIPTC